MTDKHPIYPDPLQSESQNSYQDDETSLIDLWRVLAKRKLLILTSLFVTLSLAGAWILITKPIYQSRAVLGIGQVGSLESPQLIVQRLREEYRVKDDSEGPRKLPILTEVKVMDKSLANGVEFIVQAHSAAEAQLFLGKIVSKIMDRHKKLFDMGRSEQEKQFESLLRHRDAIERGLVAIRDRISALGKGDASLAGLLTLEQDRLLQQLPQVEQQIVALRLAMSELQSTPTFLLREPTLPIKPIKPKPALYLSLAMVLGLILGVFGAFFAEFLDKVRRQKEPKLADEG